MRAPVLAQGFETKPVAPAPSPARSPVPAAKGSWKDFRGDIQPAMPKLVQQFVIDGQACTHFAGEEGYDAVRAAYLAKMTQKHCRDLDARKARLIDTYSTNFDAWAVMEEAWETEPLTLSPDRHYPPPPKLPDELPIQGPSLMMVPRVTLTPASALAATAGDWAGTLEYRDYQSNQWFGLPVKVTIQAQPDGVTTVRTAEYDDGPQTGLVWITTVQQVDAAKQTYAYAHMRKGRDADTGIAGIKSLYGASIADWTMVIEERRKDGNGFAVVRETTTYAVADDIPKLTTLKEVDPEGDGEDEFLPRNRTTLTLKYPD